MATLAFGRSISAFFLMAILTLLMISFFQALFGAFIGSAMTFRAFLRGLARLDFVVAGLAFACRRGVIFMLEDDGGLLVLN